MPDDRVEDLIRAEARKQKIPSALALAVAEQESGFNPTLINPEAVGTEHATGVFQLLPSTAKGLGVDPTDPRQNIAGGVKYLRQLLDKHQGDPNKVLAEYGGVKTDTKYVPAVTALYQKWKPTEDAADTTFFSQAARGATGGVQPPVVPGAPPPGPAAPTVGTPMPQGAAMAFPPGQEPNVVPGAPKIEALEGSSLLKDIGMGIVRAHDPREQEGRQNLFALGGELAATTFAPEVQGPIWAQRALRIGKPLIGGMLASGAEQAAENAMGGGNQTPALNAAATQGMYNVFGTAMLWIPKRAGKMLVATSVGRAAKTMLDENLARAGDRMRADVNALRVKRDEAIQAGRILTQNTLETIRAEGADLLSKLPTVRGVTATARAATGTRTRAQMVALAARTADTELANSAALSEIKAVFNDVQAQFGNPGVVRTAQLAREVFTGPTKVALDLAGERVAAAASQGPPVPFKPIQATIERLRASSPLQTVADMLEGNGPFTPGAIANIAADQAQATKAALTDPKFAGMKTSDVVAYVADQFAKLEGGGTVDTLPVLLQRLGSADVDELPYATMHALKRVLDGSVGWDRAAKATNEQLTKGLRIEVREAMRGFEPYDAANATYGSLVNLYRKGLGGKMRRAFLNDPDAASHLLNPKKPIQAHMLHSLLIEQGAAGGDAVLGQQAWDAARSTFVHQKLLNQGIEGLEKKLTQLTTTHGDFTAAVFGDVKGQSVLHNLHTIVNSFNEVQAANAQRTAQLRLAARLERSAAADEGSLAASQAADTAAAARSAVTTATASKVAREKAMGAGRVSDATRKGNEAITEATEAGKVAIREAQAARDVFAQSSLSKPPPSIAGTIGDLSHAIYTRGQTRGGFLAVLRLLNGPSSADLLTYMAMSPRATGLFQRAAQAATRGTMSPYAERASVDLLRTLTSYLTAPDPGVVPAQAQGAGPAPVINAPAGQGPGPGPVAAAP